MQNSSFLMQNSSFLIQSLPAGRALRRDAVSFQWKNPDFLLKNPDFLLKNGDFIINQRAPRAGLAEDQAGRGRHRPRVRGAGRAGAPPGRRGMAAPARRRGPPCVFQL